MSEGNARAFAERLSTDDDFRRQLFEGWTEAQAPTLTDITRAGNVAGYDFALEDLRLVLRDSLSMREAIASLHPEFRFEQRPTEYDGGPEIYPNNQNV
jgi:hypothetical protein